MGNSNPKNYDLDQRPLFKSALLDYVLHSSLRIPDQYKVKSPPLGRGNFGEIREAYHIVLKEQRLIKIIYKNQFSEEELDNVYTEYSNLINIKNKNILKVYELSQDNRYLYIIYEHFRGRELFDKVRNEGPIKDDKRAPIIISQIIDALTYLHLNKIIYRDLKLENILYDGKTIKLFDFSKSTTYSDDRLADLVGTIHYLSPEVIKGSYDYRSDIWALGVTMYVLLTGRFPFNGSTDFEIINKILYFQPDYREEELNDQAKNLIKSLLEKKPKNRISLEKAKEHIYFQQANLRMLSEIKSRFLQIYMNINRNKINSEIGRELLLYFITNIPFIHDHTYFCDKIFSLIDTKKNNFITKIDFKDFLIKHDIEIDYEDIDAIFLKLDYYKVSAITRHEFILGSINVEKISNHLLISKYFKFIAKNSQIGIPYSELRSILKNINNSEVEKAFIRSKIVAGDSLYLDDFERLIVNEIGSNNILVSQKEMFIPEDNLTIDMEN